MSCTSFNINLTFLRYWFINFLYYLSYERIRNRQEYFKHKIVIKYTQQAVQTFTYRYTYTQSTSLTYNIPCVKGIPKIFLRSKKLNSQILYPCYHTQVKVHITISSFSNITWLDICRSAAYIYIYLYLIQSHTHWPCRLKALKQHSSMI